MLSRECLHFECDENRDDFIDRMAKLKVFVDNISNIYLANVGDFNANCFRQSVFGTILQKLCDDNSLIIADRGFPMCYLYVLQPSRGNNIMA